MMKGFVFKHHNLYFCVCFPIYVYFGHDHNNGKRHGWLIQQLSLLVTVFNS